MSVISSHAKTFAMQQRTSNCDELAQELKLTVSGLYDKLMAEDDAAIFEQIEVWEPFESFGRVAVLEEIESTAYAAQMLLDVYVKEQASTSASDMSVNLGG